MNKKRCIDCNKSLFRGLRCCSCGYLLILEKKRKMPIKCDGCDKTVKNTNTLRVHKLFKHPELSLHPEVKSKDSKMSKESKEETIISDLPKEIKEHKTPKEEVKKKMTEQKEEFENQCGSCSQQFNGNPSNCPSCGKELDF